MKRASKKSQLSILTFENLIGLALAILIVFDLKLERHLANVINTPVGIVLCLVLLVVMFVFMNPIVGLLFLIYVYETVKYSSSFLYEYTQPVENVRKSLMHKLNLSNVPRNDDVEVTVIERMAPIVKKQESFGVNYVPNSLQLSKSHSSIRQ